MNNEIPISPASMASASRFRRLTMCMAMVVAVTLSSCAGHPREQPILQAAIAERLEPEFDPETQQFSLRFSVLTYNIAGLPWPVGKKRGVAAERIGSLLGEMRERGKEPDVVLLQEAFTADVGRLIQLSGYPNFVRGPTAADKPPPDSSYIAQEPIRDRIFLKGEGLGKLVGSGLYILSNYLIIDKEKRPFSRFSCAGWDCLANKGVLLARIEIPGVPAPIDLFTTHLNSRRAAGVPVARSLAAHRAQVDELDDFVDAHIREDHPLIFGGDFNTRRSPKRFDYLQEAVAYPTVRQWCVETGRCEVRMSFDGDAPWLDTQDLQGFHDGEVVSVRPVVVEAVFDEPYLGDMLSDHDGYLVTYELRWPKATVRSKVELGRVRADRAPAALR